MQTRALATRKCILDATVQSLFDRGYAGTTTQEVCRRANVSRGTLQHHFRIRNDLLLAALAHVLTTVVEDFMTARKQEGEVSPQELVPLMWEQWQGPALTAWLELAVAARTNPELREPMRRVMLEFDELVQRTFGELVGVDAIPAQFREVAPVFVFTLLNGLAVARSYEQPGQQAPVLTVLQTLIASVLGESYE